MKRCAISCCEKPLLGKESAVCYACVCEFALTCRIAIDDVYEANKPPIYRYLSQFQTNQADGEVWECDIEAYTDAELIAIMREMPHLPRKWAQDILIGLVCVGTGVDSIMDAIFAPNPAGQLLLLEANHA